MKFFTELAFWSGGLDHSNVCVFYSKVIFDSSLILPLHGKLYVCKTFSAFLSTTLWHSVLRSGTTVKETVEIGKGRVGRI